MREAAATAEDARSTLAARQAELEATAQQAMRRDRQLLDACEAAEGQTAAARRRAEDSAAEASKLRWAVSQAEEALAAETGAARTARSERDDAVAALGALTKTHAAVEADASAAAARAREAEAALIAMRASYSSRLADAERSVREGAAAVERMRLLERQLHESERLRAADQQQYSKVALVLSRLAELENMFGDMLAPVSARAHSYLTALQEIANPEVKITPSFHRGGQIGNLPPPPPLVVATYQPAPDALGGAIAPATGRPRADDKPSTMDGRAPPNTTEQSGAAGRSAADAPPAALRNASPRRLAAVGGGGGSPRVQSHYLSAAPSGRSPRRSPRGSEASAFYADGSSPHRGHALGSSMSLPVLRTPSLPAAGTRKVARGSVRVAARQGVSVGELKQARQGMLAVAPPLEDVLASMHRERPPPLPILPVGALYHSASGAAY